MSPFTRTELAADVEPRAVACRRLDVAVEHGRERGVDRAVGVDARQPKALHATDRVEVAADVEAALAVLVNCEDAAEDEGGPWLVGRRGVERDAATGHRPDKENRPM